MSGEFRPGQMVTVFRSRLRPEHAGEYGPDATAIFGLASAAPGFVDAKTFEAADGERVTIVTFADEASQNAWREDARHVAAQERGRESYYAGYSIQVCSTVRVSGFTAPQLLDQSQLST